MKNIKQDEGFTIIELILIIVVISLLRYLIIYILDSDKVTIRFERVSSFALFNLDVFANGVKIGSVDDGEVKTLKFTPKKDGDNTIIAEAITAIGPNIKSNIIHIHATPGAIIYARSELDRWEMKLMSNLVLTASIETEGTTVDSGGVSTPSDKASNSKPIPWDAIGAIAGIFGTIGTFLALRK